MNERIMQNCTSVYAASARAMIRVMGMQAENMDDMMMKKRPRYEEKDFLNVIKEEAIGYNDVQGLLNR